MTAAMPPPVLPQHMLSVEEARARILAGLQPTAAEIVGLSDAWDRVAAAPIAARLMHPPADVSAMDGYALHAVDGAPHAVLRVIGSAPAGHPFAGQVQRGEAVRVFTGSIIPAGLDGVLVQEDAIADGDQVTIRERVQTGKHIRLAGQDFRAGEVLVPAGRRLTARDIGAAAAANHPWIAVHRRPVVAILATGDEIALPGNPIPPGGIVSSNAHALAALVRAGGGQPLVLPIAPDDRAAIAAATASARTADLLLTTGGASVGTHDLVLSALQERGLELDFWKIAMRPGKPLMHGHVGEMPMIGLPGNPVSAIVCAVLFVLPALARLCGRTDTAVPLSRAVLGAPLPANDRRADHLRATLSPRDPQPPLVTPFPVQDSGMLARLAHSQALILRAPMAPPAQAGADVTVIRLDLLGI
jgi:molybdopterin molybdotransferase